MMYRLMTDTEIMQDLGRQFEALRISKQIKDTDLEAAGGIARKTVYNFRQGSTAISLRSFIRLLRGIGELDRLETLLAPSDLQRNGYSPRTDGYSGQSRERQPKRVRDRVRTAEGFSWGDEQ